MACKYSLTVLYNGSSPTASHRFEWDVESVSVSMATKCQGVEELWSWDGYEFVRDPVDHQ